MKSIDAKIAKQIQETEIWLEKNGGDCKKKQSHLVEGTEERVYWHYGYMMALKDTLRLLNRERAKLN